jgi:hypothetical protein
MKKLTLLLTALALTAASAPDARAGDKEWATAGKILTGVFAGSVLTRALDPAPAHVYHTTTVYHPAPAVVSTPVYVQPQVVYARPAPVVVQTAPVVVHAAPVCVQPRVIYVQPAPVVTYHHVHRHQHYGHHRVAFYW